MAKCNLTERILIESLIESQDDEGFNVENWQEYYKCWSGFKTIKGSEFIAASATNSENIVTFTIRYCKKASLLLDSNATKKYRILYKKKSYNIIYVNDYNNLHQWIDIKSILVN